MKTSHNVIESSKNPKRKLTKEATTLTFSVSLLATTWNKIFASDIKSLIESSDKSLIKH